MGLPARQQRKLDLIEGELRASAPHLVSMFGIFSRLSRDDGPAMTERLRPSRLRAALPGLPAFVLVPVAIAMVVIGIVFGGTGPDVHQGAGHQRPPDRVIQLVLPGQ